MATFGLPGIPWAFLNNDLMKIWVWRTDHFEARVTAGINSFNWEITDLINSADGLFLAEGITGDFNDAENAVRETIGKSYPPKYGYGAYAGPLATTFRIATGEDIDFHLFTGKRTVVTVRLPNGRDQVFVGAVRVVHYEVHLTPDTGPTVRIQPSHIVKVTGEGGRTLGTARASYTGMGRVYRGQRTHGCNGVPGFMPDTIDHTGDPCAIHEDSLPRFG